MRVLFSSLILLHQAATSFVVVVVCIAWLPVVLRIAVVAFVHACEEDRDSLARAAMARLVDYFVVCGLGPDLHAIDGSRGFQGTGMRYQPALLDQFPPLATPECHPPPPQLPLVSKQARFWGKKKLARLSVLLPIRSRAFSSSFFLGSLLSRGFLSNVGAMRRMIELRFRFRVRLRVFWMQCVLPGGVEIYSTGPNSQDPSSFPRSYPIVLTGLHSPYCD